MRASDLIFKMATFIGERSSFDEFTTSAAVGIAIKALTGCNLSSATVYNDGRIEVRSYGPEDTAKLAQHFACKTGTDEGYKGLVVQLLPA